MGGDAEWEDHKTLSDEAVAAEVVKALQSIYPKNPCSDAKSSQEAEHFVSFPAQWKVTRWSQDPFALGAYTELQSPSASERDRQIYAQQEGLLLFTGEGAVPGQV